MVLSTIIKPLQENKGEKRKRNKNWLQLIKVIPIHPIDINAKND